MMVISVEGMVRETARHRLIGGYICVVSICLNRPYNLVKIKNSYTQRSRQIDASILLASYDSQLIIIFERSHARDHVRNLRYEIVKWNAT